MEALDRFKQMFRFLWNKFDMKVSWPYLLIFFILFMDRPLNECVFIYRTYHIMFHGGLQFY